MRFPLIMFLCLLVFGLLAMPGTAHAYIGPGLGAGVVATVLGLLAAFIMLFVALVWYPLKKLFKVGGVRENIAPSDGPDK